jgi:hypothetical protein
MRTLWQIFRSGRSRQQRGASRSERQPCGGRVVEALEPRRLLATTALQIVPAASHLSASVSVVNNSVSFSEQAAGSLTTTYGGTIVADLSSQAVTVSSGSSADANVSGNWQPGGIPADYGGQASILGQTAFATINNLQFNITSAPLTLATQNGFNPDGIHFALDSGLIDASLGSFGSVDRSLAGLISDDSSSTSGLIQPVAGGGTTITIPVHLVYFFSVSAINDSTLTLDGTIVASTSGTVSTGPILTLLQGATPLSSGQTQPVILGPAGQRSVPVVETFTAINTGDQTLTLGAPTVPPGFTLVQAPPAKLAVGASGTFQLALDTDSAGSFFGSVAIPTNDQFANPFTFAVSGTVTAPIQSLLSVAQVILHQPRRPVIGGSRKTAARVQVLLVNNNSAALHGPVLLRLFVATDPFLPPDPSMQLDSRRMQIALAGNAQKLIDLRFGIPALPSGTYFIVALISGSNVVGDGNSDVSATSIQVIDSQPFAKHIRSG